MKQYFTGFFTAVCLTASVFIFMGSQNKNLGDIEADSIVLRGENRTISIISGAIFISNADGKMTAYLGTGKGGGHFQTFNEDGKQTAYLGTGEDGSGYLKTYNSDNKQTSYLGTNINGNGLLSVENDGNIGTFSIDGTKTSSLGTGKSGGGKLLTYNKHGVMVGYFGNNKMQYGTIIISDSDGGPGWAKSGKE